MAINTYNSQDKTQLSEHFNAKEFRCKCGKDHRFKVDSELIEQLEKLFMKLGASKCIISSGFRCVAHDKKVGGSGTGQHTKGKAADICFYDKNGKPISSKLVSCVAQDLGFGGIANINRSYTYTHLDTRTSKKYMGDETKSRNSVTTDFYKYYGISKSNETNSNANAAVKAWQQAALKDGFSLPSGADGIFGQECIAVAKKAICKYNTLFYKYKNLTRIIQAAVGAVEDGMFGKATEAAVKAYQKKHRLKVDGIVGINTWKKILNI